MHIFENISFVLISIIALWGGAYLVVESASRIAKKLGLSELVIGLTIVAIATSAPEFAVTVLAAFRGHMQISVGNIVGSNIFNLGIILGLVSIFSVVKISKPMLYRDGGLLVGAGVLLLIFFYDLSLSVWEGLTLIAILISYIIYLVRHKENVEEEELPSGGYRWYDPVLFAAGIAIILAGADFLVDGATGLARYFGLSEWLIAVTIVASGTSIPELATSIVALSKGRHGISAGNLIGSDLFNMLGVLGVATLFRSLQITSSDYFSLILLAGNLIILVVLMRRKWRLTTGEGIILILIALARWAVVIN
ncbi:MAG: calcium/sodium antiporter [Chlorobi bacterium]|nr:calcium/sodium antiporter [Chlorobiota bacterium]